MDEWMVAVFGIYVIDLFVSTLEQQKSQRFTREKSHPMTALIVSWPQRADGASKCRVPFQKSEGGVRTS